MVFEPIKGRSENCRKTHGVIKTSYQLLITKSKGWICCTSLSEANAVGERSLLIA